MKANAPSQLADVLVPVHTSDTIVEARFLSRSIHNYVVIRYVAYHNGRCNLSVVRLMLSLPCFYIPTLNKALLIRLTYLLINYVVSIYTVFFK